MHLYWRVKEELQSLGEILIFKDPSLLREYRRWLRKNSAALAYISEKRPGSLMGLPDGFAGIPSLN